jgi:glycosyltransferase involved in cell wall biosynthesis
MKISVICEKYPDANVHYAMTYVHTRNLEYVALGADVTVYSASAHNDYVIDRVCVRPLAQFNASDNVDVIVAHAPNLRNHLRVLLYLKQQNVVFIFHGHEVLRVAKSYPAPYSWQKSERRARWVRTVYDEFKILVLRRWLGRLRMRGNRVGIIFVSEYLKSEFFRNFDAPPEAFGDVRVIPNGVGGAFSSSQYEYSKRPDSADVITIRPLDPATYALDLVVRCSIENPGLTFHVFGTGKFFNHVSMPKNLRWMGGFVKPSEIPKLMNGYRVAYMPTRHDTQGVINCEIAALGMPLITSDLPVCIEMLGWRPNVSFLSNSRSPADLMSQVHAPSLADVGRFDPVALAQSELDFFFR